MRSARLEGREVDASTLSVAPLLLGGGTRLLDGLDSASLDLEQVRAIDAPGAAHLTYRVRRPA